MAREYQEHDGAVDGNTLYVQYDYEDGASGGVAKYVRLSQVTYPNGREVHFGYGQAQAIDDIMSRLATIGDGANTYASYKYLGAGRIVVEDYEDIEVKLDYSANNFAALDRFGRVVDQVWLDYGSDPDVVLDHYSYEYDRAGNRTSRTNQLNHDFDEVYEYDGIDRLISSTRADDFDQSWGLDGLGNFSTFDDDGDSQTRTANAANEITAITGGWITPAYDAAGNLTSGPRPGDETTRVHYRYDAWNRLVKVFADDSGEPGDLIAAYEYDGANRRIEKTFADDSGVEYFYNHDWQMIEERAVDDEGAPTAVNQYVWSARYIDAPVIRLHDANADGDVLDEGDNTRHFTGDANYNVTATIDAATGDVVERYVYTAYGEATVYDEDWANPAAPTTDGPLYCGYFFDAETGLYQVRNRYYDSSLSTFISRDPVQADINLYRYCANNPLLYTDPTGRDWLDCMAECIKDNDPLPYALGAGIKAILLTGGWETKAMVAQMFKALGYTELAKDILHYANMPGASKLTNIMSTIGTVLSKMGTTQSTAMWHKLGGAASSILGPIEVAYGLSLAAIEVHCTGWCCTAWWYGIPYNHADGNVINAWKNYYFGKWL